jgi:hypothetical protein
MRSARTAVGLLAFSFAVSSPADEGAEKKAGGFWWGGADIGFASVSRTYSVTASTRDSTFALAFRGGYAWNPRLLLGVELGGWTLQATTYPFGYGEEGEGIQTLLAIAQYYPKEGSSLFLKAGYGNVSYWNNRPLENGGHGHNAVIGLGYDIAFGKSWYATPAIEFARGSIDGATTPPLITQDPALRGGDVQAGGDVPLSISASSALPQPRTRQPAYTSLA